jgi:hypothetical protein
MSEITIDNRPKIKYSNKLTDYLYANIIINNELQNRNILAQYSSTQNLPLIGKQEDFEMRVVRFKIPMATVPLFVYNEDKYFISVARGVTRENPADFEVLNQFGTGIPIEKVEVPFISARSPDDNQMPVPYERGIYSIKDFLFMLNTAMRTLWLQVEGPTLASYPYFRYDECCGTFELVMPTETIPAVEGVPQHQQSQFYPQNPTGYRLLLSSPLYTLFSGFSAYKLSFRNGFEGDTDLMYALSVNSFSCKEIAQCDEPYAFNLPDEQSAQFYHCYKQAQSSVYAWLQASRIVVTSSMSVVREAILLGADDNRPERLELLTDFHIEQNNDVGHKEYIYYTDSGTERYMNIKDEGPLRRIDMKIFIEFEQGILVPLYIAPGAECNLKLGFRRKWHNDLYQISDADRHTKGP